MAHKKETLTKKSKPLKRGINKVGRPTKLTPEIIAKLEEAFLFGSSDISACFYAGISTTALYDYQKLHPEFTERKEALKQDTVFKALKVIKKSLETNDVNTAKWLLERKCKDDYSTKTEITGVKNESIIFNILPVDTKQKKDEQ